MQTQDVCEYTLHGRDGDYQCCPHGVTPPQGPPEQCCVDDLPKSPYRLDFARALRSAASPAVQQGAGGDQSVTDLTFVVQVRKQTGGGADYGQGVERAVGRSGARFCRGWHYEERAAAQQLPARFPLHHTC